MVSAQRALSELQTCLNNPESKQLCTECKDYFSNVTSMYSNAPFNCRATVDIIDAYRRGLSAWSEHNCPSPVPGKQPVYVILALVFVWVVVFYGLSRAFTKKPAQFFFGRVMTPTSVDQRLEDTPHATSLYFERTGPGLRGEGLQYDDPDSPEIDTTTTRRRLARQNGAENE